MQRTRKLSAVMFTDIQGYTALMQRSEVLAVQIREKHRDIFDNLTKKYHGVIVNYYGDGTLSIFDSVVDAVHCGHELQMAFTAKPAIPVRVGIHLGDIIITEDDIIGNSVNIASRIESMGVVGSVLLSDTVQKEISNHEDLKCKDLGEYWLKNDDQPRTIFALDLPGLEVPAHGTLKGKTAIREKSAISTKIEGKIPIINWFNRHQRSTKGILSLLIIAIFMWLFVSRPANRNWTRAEALPAIAELADQQNYRDAFLLAKQAEKAIKKDAGLQSLWTKISTHANFYSDPPGVEVSRKLYDASDDQWELLGLTPLENEHTYLGPSLWKFKKDGYLTAVRLMGSLSNDSVVVNMDEISSVPGGMVRIQGGQTHLGFIIGVDFEGLVHVNSFFIDKYEVTNADYQKFVNAGGYHNQNYWNAPFVKGGDTLSFEEAMTIFKDKTGRTAPATWELEQYVEGKALYPVSGVSWYEANAYANFVGKALPTMFHWNMAATIWFSDLIISHSNIEGTEIAPVGEYQGISSGGVYDMAGNVREWIWNAADSNNLQYLVGGAWNDPNYLFSEVGTIDPFDRTHTNGFRCIQNIDEVKTQNHLIKPLPSIKDFLVEEPVSDEVFAHYKRQFIIDQSPFNEILDSVSLPQEDRNCQKITFDAAYGGEKMSVYLYTPTNATPPFQTVVFFPGSGATYNDYFDPIADGALSRIDFVLKSGRALLFPIIKGTYDRNNVVIPLPGKTAKYRDLVIMLVKDIIRSVDYLETRSDIDTSHLAYYGFSWGARLGGIVLAVEPRFKAAVLTSGGIDFQKPNDEVAVINYLPRVQTPTRMLNGKYDICCFPVEASQKPFFNLLGTLLEHKEHTIFENAAHIPSRANLIKGTLDWYDKYLGQVSLKKRIREID